MNFIQSIFKPAIYHGHQKTAPFFEGWYYKLITADELNKCAIIPGVFLGKDGHAFIQVLDGNTGVAVFINFPLEVFSAAEEDFRVQIDRNVFQLDSIHVDIDRPELRLKGDLSFAEVTGWPVTLTSPGVMGWYAWIPKMECYHGVLGFDHAINGLLTVNGAQFDFNGGRGYIEKDWGTAFPEGYVWMQANHSEGIIVMVAKKFILFVLTIFLLFVVGCSGSGEGGIATPLTAGFSPITSVAGTPPATVVSQTAADLPAPVFTQQFESSTPTASPTSTVTPTPTETEIVFEVGEELTIEYLRGLEITGSEITFEQVLQQTFYYQQHLVSYISEGNKIYGLLTIPVGEPPEGGFKAIVFNHGYIPPAAYRTTERYIAYVDYLARSGFVVFKIDYRGHGQSEGEPSGTYFSPGYTLDAIAALKSLQTLDIIDPQGIGMWGHSMAGNLVLRAMLIEPDIKAGVIWAGAVYSYDDFGLYGITDNTYRPPATPDTQGTPAPRRRSQEIFDTYGRPDTQVGYWQAVSLTENIEFLNRPLQLHHAEDDTVVNIAYSFGLSAVLQENGKEYEFYTYEGGGHNLVSPYFDQAMLRTVEFFRNNL